MFFNNRCMLVLWMKVASALEGLSHGTIYAYNHSFKLVRNGKKLLKVLNYHPLHEEKDKTILLLYFSGESKTNTGPCEGPSSRRDERYPWRG